MNNLVANLHTPFPTYAVWGFYMMVVPLPVALAASIVAVSTLALRALCPELSSDFGPLLASLGCAVVCMMVIGAVLFGVGAFSAAQQP